MFREGSPHYALHITSNDVINEIPPVCVFLWQVVEGLRGMLCQKVCATSQFSLALTAAGKVGGVRQLDYVQMLCLVNTRLNFGRT